MLEHQTLSYHHPFDLLLQASLDQQLDDATQLLNLKNLKNYQPTNSEMADVYNAIENITKKKKQSSRKHSACHNRECNNPPGYKNKPNSIYCSSRCQSRGKNPFFFVLTIIFYLLFHLLMYEFFIFFLYC